VKQVGVKCYVCIIVAQQMYCIKLSRLFGEEVSLMKERFVIDCVWNVIAHTQKPDFVFRRNGRVHLNRRGRQFSRLLAAEMCASAVIMLDTPRSEVVWRVLATHSIRHFPLHFPSRASPCAIRFQTHCTHHCALRIDGRSTSSAVRCFFFRVMWRLCWRRSPSEFAYCSSNIFKANRSRFVTRLLRFIICYQV